MAAERKRVIVKGGDASPFPPFASRKELETALEAAGWEIASNLSAACTHVVVSKAWVDAKPANQKWAATATTRAIVADSTELAPWGVVSPSSGPVAAGAAAAAPAAPPRPPSAAAAAVAPRVSSIPAAVSAAASSALPVASPGPAAANAPAAAPKPKPAAARKSALPPPPPPRRWEPYAGGELFPADEDPQPRPSRWSDAPNADTRARLARASAQRLYLLDRLAADGAGSGPEQRFSVLGSTGNVYTVRICERSSCTCPDAARTRLCKHVLFVLLRVLRVPSGHALAHQPYLAPSELRYIFAHAPDPRGRGAPLANAAARAAAAASLGYSTTATAAPAPAPAAVAAPPAARAIGPDDDCAICYEALLGGGGSLVHCAACRGSLHAACMAQWSAAKRAQGHGGVSCPLCREKWVTPAPPPAAASAARGGGTAAVRSPEGYVNVASLAGVSRERDTSSYYSGSSGGGGWRRGGWRADDLYGGGYGGYKRKRGWW